MKKLIILVLLAFAVSASAQNIRVNVIGNDPVSGKKVKADLNYITTSPDGSVARISYMVRYFENDNVTPAIPSGNSARQKKIVESFEETFDIGNKSILSTTKVYSPLFDNQEPPVAIPNAILISEYLRTRSLTLFPGVGNGSAPLRDLNEGILREIIAIPLANGEIL